MVIFGLRIFTATLKMYSQTGYSDQAETFKNVKGMNLGAVYKISSWYRPIKAENGNKNT